MIEACTKQTSLLQKVTFLPFFYRRDETIRIHNCNCVIKMTIKFSKINLFYSYIFFSSQRPSSRPLLHFATNEFRSTHEKKARQHGTSDSRSNVDGKIGSFHSLFFPDGTSTLKVLRGANRSSSMTVYVRSAALWLSARRESRIPANTSVSSTIPSAVRASRLFWLLRHRWLRKSSRVPRPSTLVDPRPSPAPFKATRSRPSPGSRTASLSDWRTACWGSRAWRRRTRECISALLEMTRKAHKRPLSWNLVEDVS